MTPLYRHPRLSLFASSLGSTLSLWRGTHVRNGLKPKPRQTLLLYDQEGLPDCKLVREVLTEFDLEVMVYPCPRGGCRFSQQLVVNGERLTPPVLYDPNQEIYLNGMASIIRHLDQYYGTGGRIFQQRSEEINRLLALASSLLRGGAGLYVKRSLFPALPMTLYSFESSPYTKPVRELLCELEIPCLIHNVGKVGISDYIVPRLRKPLLGLLPVAGANRRRFLERSGQLMVPFLVDPNTGTELFESREIIRYLLENYAV